MGLRKTAFSTFLLALALYVFLPTPDQILIFPVVTAFLAYGLHVSVVFALILTSLFYYGVGVASLLGALAIGGKSMYWVFRERMLQKKRNCKYAV